MAEGVLIAGASPEVREQAIEGFLGTGLSLGTEITLVAIVLFGAYVAFALARYYGLRFNPVIAIASTLGLTND